MRQPTNNAKLKSNKSLLKLMPTNTPTLRPGLSLNTRRAAGTTILFCLL